MRKHGFFENFGTILLYAVSPPSHESTRANRTPPTRTGVHDLPQRILQVLGTMLAIIATGALVYALAAGGAIASSFSFPQAMLFAALISSTDPVATLSILKRVKAQVGPSSHRNQIVITPQPDRDQIVKREIVPPQPLLCDLVFGDHPAARAHLTNSPVQSHLTASPVRSDLR